MRFHSDIRRGGFIAVLCFLSLGSVHADFQKIKVVTTLFPLTDWVHVIGGDAVEVHQLLPPGVEAHAYAPRPSDLLELNRARVFIYMGSDMEPWADRLISETDSTRLLRVEAGRSVARKDAQGEADPESDDGHGTERHPDAVSHPHKGTDPHIWLDPVLAQQIVLEIATALGQVAPECKDRFSAAAEAYNQKLQTLHKAIEEGLTPLRHREILYGGHFTFGYFARRYHLSHASPYPGFSPNATPTPAGLADMIRKLKISGQTTLFHEELLDPRMARVLAEETGAKLQVLHGAHNLSRDELARGDVTYLSIMYENLSRLRDALGAANESSD